MCTLTKTEYPVPHALYSSKHKIPRNKHYKILPRRAVHPGEMARTLNCFYFPLKYVLLHTNHVQMTNWTPRKFYYLQLFVGWEAAT